MTPVALAGFAAGLRRHIGASRSGRASMSRSRPPHSRAGHVRGLLRRPGFRRLYGTRLAGQFGDGVFQASLAGAVLFSPERQAHPRDIALGFAVLLLPYSLIGPFAGVLIDRWWRQRVLGLANAARAAGVLAVAAVIGAGAASEVLYLAALCVMSINRFVLSSLSASLTHVLGARDEASRELISATAFSTTTGGLATALGGGAAIALRAAIGSANLDYALIAAAAAAPYLGAAALAAGFGRAELGPDDLDRARRDSARDVAHGLIGGIAHIRARPAVRRALALIAGQRMGSGVALVSTVLLYRNHFADHGVLRAGLAGLGQVALAMAAGVGLAALITPAITRRIPAPAYCGALLGAGAASLLALMLRYQIGAVLCAAFLAALVSQAVKICVDAVVQTGVEDEFRGRVFALYDTLINLA
ncbi:MAG: MFS transporter, partial [Frankiaceae bacterium]|nr:MFS transporter [Frankiaceae bacterium]